MQTQFAQHRSDLRILNDQIRYTGQYYANKEVYSQFSNAKYKGKYRKEHAKEIQKYEEARNWLRSFYQDGKMTSLKTLTLQKEKLQQQIGSCSDKERRNPSLKLHPSCNEQSNRYPHREDNGADNSRYRQS